MYPVLVRIGTFEITSFGIMVDMAALVRCGFRWELAFSRLPAGPSDSRSTIISLSQLRLVPSSSANSAGARDLRQDRPTVR